MNREEIIRAIQDVAKKYGRKSLRFHDFNASTGISRRCVLKQFDSWSAACQAAGVAPGPTGKVNLIPNRAISSEQCIAELQRVAAELGRTYLSRREFAERSSMHPETPARRFGGWDKALAAAGLQMHPDFRREIPFDLLVGDFLRVVQELRAVPTLRQLARRSIHGEYLFSEKQGGYPQFKARAIAHLLSVRHGLSHELASVLRAELERLSPPCSNDGAAPRPHQHGRMLGFRGFAHEPTYEMEVVSLFGAIAEELGFEILSVREEFPDCRAQRRLPGRRKRYKECLIEFELRSSDFRIHGHRPDGCDLIVCWENDWVGCPVEVLELRQAIQTLHGWRKKRG